MIDSIDSILIRFVKPFVLSKSNCNFRIKNSKILTNMISGILCSVTQLISSPVKYVKRSRGKQKGRTKTTIPFSMEKKHCHRDICSCLLKLWIWQVTWKKRSVRMNLLIWKNTSTDEKYSTAHSSQITCQNNKFYSC